MGQATQMRIRRASPNWSTRTSSLQCRPWSVQLRPSKSRSSTNRTRCVLRWKYCCIIEMDIHIRILSYLLLASFLWHIHCWAATEIMKHDSIKISKLNYWNGLRPWKLILNHPLTMSNWILEEHTIFWRTVLIISHLRSLNFVFVFLYNILAGLLCGAHSEQGDVIYECARIRF